jgi:putative ABC transport system permease protein
VIWWRRLLQRDGAKFALEKELQFHIDEKVESLMRSGLPAQEAQRRVRLEFGGIEQVKEQCREVRRFNIVDRFAQDLRYAMRSLGRSPGFVFTAVCTLALGIGANTAIFSVISGVLLRPLPFADSGRLVQVNEFDPRNGTGPVEVADLQEWRRQSRSFDGMFAYGSISKDLQQAHNPERIGAARVERGLFRMLGVQTVAGRFFREDDPARVVVLSAGFWKRHFGGDPSVTGSKIVLDGEPHTVVGVMPEQFQFPLRASSVELWIPWDLQPRGRIDVVGRLRDGVTVHAAQSELTMLAGGPAESHVEARGPETRSRRDAVVAPLSDAIVGKTRSSLLTLLGAVGLVLLIACANVMNLVLARGAGRTHELALRAALGAGRGRLVQQLLTESLLISVAGAAAGFLIAFLSRGMLLQLVSSRIPRAAEIGFDWRVFAFLLVVGLGAGILFGLLPAFTASHLDVQRGLTATRSVGYGSSRWSGRRLRDGLIVAEIAMAFVLVVGAGLLLQAFLHLQNTPTGFVRDHVLTLNMSAAVKQDQTRRPYGLYLGELEERLHAIPGVQASGFIQFLPLQNWGWWGFFTIPQRPPQTLGHKPQAELRFVSPGYFSALGIPLRRGRTFDIRDASGTQPVILINEALARRYFPNEDPVGQRTDRGTIIGVVGDVRQSGLDRPAVPEIYRPFGQGPAATSEAGISVVVRTHARPEALVNAVRSTIHQVNPNQAIFNVKTMDQVIAESLGDLNLYVWLLGAFAGMAVLLAVAGIYGVVSYAVTGRTQEFAVRLALGAARRQISILVLGHGSMLLFAGLSLGVAGALALARTLRRLSSTVTSPDAATLVAVALLLAAVTLAACLMPARRATRVDPNMALKYE